MVKIYIYFSSSSMGKWFHRNKTAAAAMHYKATILLHVCQKWNVIMHVGVHTWTSASSQYADNCPKVTHPDETFLDEHKEKWVHDLYKILHQKIIIISVLMIVTC